MMCTFFVYIPVSFTNALDVDMLLTADAQCNVCQVCDMSSSVKACCHNSLPLNLSAQLMSYHHHPCTDS